MDLFAAAERLMGMDGRAWERHANPWSVWSRFATLPLLALAIWSRSWIGWWSLIPLALVIAWIWVNPRAFPPPADWGNWASRATLGERLWLARRRLDLPRHHVRAAWIATMIAAAGVLPLVWGLGVLDPGWTVAGVAVVSLGKLWFADRMVWLHRDVSGLAPGIPIDDPTTGLPPVVRTEGSAGRARSPG